MKLLIALLFLPIAVLAQAQTRESSQKIGHADWEYIFSQLPEYKQIEAELRTFEAQLQNQLKMKSQEFENKYKEYLSLPEETPDAVRKDKESELTFLQDALQKFKADAQQSIQKKQHDLLSPIIEKVGKAIEDVAVENDYAYIINPQVVGGGDILLYASEDYNISDLVLKKLGIVITK